MGRLPQSSELRNADDWFMQLAGLLDPYGHHVTVPRGRKGLLRALLDAHESRLQVQAASLDHYRAEAIRRREADEAAAFAQVVTFSAAEASTGYLARVANAGGGVDVHTANPGEHLATVISLDDLRARRARQAS
jgi:hypothetical protein